MERLLTAMGPWLGRLWWRRRPLRFVLDDARSRFLDPPSQHATPLMELIAEMYVTNVTNEPRRLVKAYLGIDGRPAVVGPPDSQITRPFLARDEDVCMLRHEIAPKAPSTYR